MITAMRTAAASAIATKYLAQKTETLAVIGSGVQATSHAECFLRTFPSFKKVNYLNNSYVIAAIFLQSDIQKVNIWNHRKPGAEQLARHLTESFKADFQVYDQIEDCVKDADVIVVATFATGPLLMDFPMNPWVHINCKNSVIQINLPELQQSFVAVGAPRPDWQELNEDLMRNSVVYVDSTQSASHESGDIIKSGAEIYAEIGEVIRGGKEALISKRTIFKSLGISQSYYSTVDSNGYCFLRFSSRGCSLCATGLQ